MTDDLQRALDRAHDADIAVHSVAVSIGGEEIVDTAVAPWGSDVPHRMYSVSKSVTAVAVLLLAEEGRLNLRDPIMDHFPEMGTVHPWLAATLIDDMLAMTGPHSRTTYGAQDDDWLESYFRVAPTHRPGTLFTYDTSASYVLSALIERLAGMPMLDYLRPRLLDPLGVGSGMRFLTGPEGISHGGSGLIAAPRDMLRIADAVTGTVAVLPETVRDLLLEHRSDPGTQTWGAALRHGYGRQIWLPGGEDWLMFGLGGQVVYGDPSRRLSAVVTADATVVDSGDQRLVDLLMTALAGDVGGDVQVRPPTPPHDPVSAAMLHGVGTLVSGEGAPPRLRVMTDATGGEIEIPGASLRFDTTSPTVTTLPLGDAVTTAGWSSPGVLDVRVSAAADDIASVRMRLVATDDGILTVMSQGSGPEIGAEWTWRGSYRMP